jgi:Response regulator containing a CheY-like receiver domain and an HTH DNA-binding domain
MNIVGFTKGKDIISFSNVNHVQVVLLDVMLPDMSGIDVCRELKKMSPHTIVLMISNQPERHIIFQALQYGANGYLLKNTNGRELVECVYEALNGNIAFDNEVKNIMTRPAEKQLQELPRLTKREKQIIGLIAEGKTTQQIADTVFISPFTVDTHRRNLLQKLQAKNRVELIRITIEYMLF